MIDGMRWDGVKTRRDIERVKCKCPGQARWDEMQDEKQEMIEKGGRKTYMQTAAVVETFVG